MNRSTPTVLATGALAASMLVDAHVFAGGNPSNSFSLIDGTALFSLTNLIGQRLGNTGGSGNLETENGTAAELDHMFQNFFWYRGPGDAREYALSNQTSNANFLANRVNLFYTEPFDDGAIANGMDVLLLYSLSDLSTVADQPRAVVRIEVRVTNLTAGPATVQFFWYNDMDLGGSAGGDSAGTGGANSRFVHAVSSVTPQVPATCSGTASNHAHFQIAAFDTIRAQLADAGIDNLTDTGTTFGPGDYTGAHQWTLSLGAAGSATATANLFMQMEVAVNRCPADTNRSGGVDVDDLINVILGWGACP